MLCIGSTSGESSELMSILEETILDCLWLGAYAQWALLERGLLRGHRPLGRSNAEGGSTVDMNSVQACVTSSRLAQLLADTVGGASELSSGLVVGFICLQR